MNDYPAAHSMDTNWFAIDNHGHVGRFESGEAGAVPTAVDGNFVELPDALAAVSDTGPLECYVDDIATEADGKLFELGWNRLEPREVSLASLNHETIYGCLIWLRDDSPFRAPEQRGLWSWLRGPTPPRLFRLPNSRYVLAWASQISKRQLQTLIDKRLVLRAWTGHLSASRFGIFEYEHDERFENWIAGPYLRNGLPASPVRWDELPDDIKGELGFLRSPLRLPVDFSRDLAIQPMDLEDCASWQDRWIGLNGEVHGNEDEEA